MNSQQSIEVERLGPEVSLEQAAAHLATAKRTLDEAARCIEHALSQRPRRNGTNGSAARASMLPPEERLTMKQLGAIRAASRRAGLSDPALRDLVSEVSDDATDVTRLSKSEASSLLDKLSALNGYAR